MNTQPNHETHVKDDSSLFDLISQLTEDLPPRTMSETESNQVIPIQLYLPFSTLIQAVDQLPLAQATLLHHRLEERLYQPTQLAA